MKPILSDALKPGLQVVFCGTAVGAASARKQAYYAGPNNRFWKTIQEIGLTPSRWEPARYMELLEIGIGFTDLAKGVAGNDHILKPSHFGCEELTQKILEFRPRFLAFTSKRAAEEYLEGSVSYGLQQAQIGDTKIFVLPSPSGAAQKYWDATRWKQVAELISAQSSAAHLPLSL